MRLCLVVADAARARLFTYDNIADPAIDDNAGNLVEQDHLIEPERRLRASQIHSDSRPGTAHQSHGPSHGLDDHRDRHRDEVDRRFAGTIVGRLVQLVDDTAVDEAVVVAPPSLLGRLRPLLSKLSGRVTLHEVPRDLSRETTPQLHDHLHSLGLIAPRPRPGFRS